MQTSGPLCDLTPVPSSHVHGSVLFPRRSAPARCTTPGGVPAVRFGAVPASSPLWQQQHQHQQPTFGQHLLPTPTPQPPRQPLPHRVSSQLPTPATTTERAASASTPGTRPTSEPPRAMADPVPNRNPNPNPTLAHAEKYEGDDLSNQVVSSTAPPAEATAAAVTVAATAIVLPSSGRACEALALQQRLRQLEEALATANQRAYDLAAENALLRESQVDAADPRRRSSTGELDARLAAASSALWEGARRVAELAAERRELSERCARAEAAARAARDSCERLAMKLASALGPADGPLSRHAHATALSTPASQHRARHGDAAREALLTLGRKTCEQRAAARKQAVAVTPD